MKKIISIALIAAMLLASLCMVTSCEAASAASAIKKADKALAEAPYTVTMSMDFECDDATLNTVFDAMTMEFPVTVDGENVHMSMSTEIMGMKSGVTMTVVDKVLYSNTTVGKQSVKIKATLNEEEIEAFMKDNNTDLPVTTENFETLTVETVDGKKVITCAGISDEGLTAMNDLLAKSLSAMGAEAAVGDLSLTVTIADGKYETMALTAEYAVTIAGKTYTTTMTMNARYSYEDIQPITAPADADSYTEVSYSEIVGQ